MDQGLKSDAPETALVVSPKKKLIIKKPKRIKAGDLDRVARKMMLQVTPAVLEEFWLAVHKKIQAGDTRVLELVADMYKYAAKGGGVMVNVQQNNVAKDSAQVKSMEELVRMLEDRDRQREKTRQMEAEVIDVESE